MAVACGGADDAASVMWTPQQAASITTVRGMHVDVRTCRGLGRPRHDRGATQFRRFACVAGARLPTETYDTVGVHYMLRPLGEYHGPSSKHALENVRFIGGPGIP
jgi:hypothetical protein